MTSEHDSINSTIITAVEQVVYSPDDIRIQWAYLIIAVFMVLTAGVFLFLFACHADNPPHPSRTNIDVNGQTQTTTNLLTLRVILILVTLFLNVYYGLEIAMASFLTTYAVKSDLKLTKDTGALMTSTYWGTFTFFRLTTMFYIDFIGAQMNLALELGLIVIANIFLIPFGNMFEWALWAGSAIIGLGMSSIWASMYAYVETSLCPVSDRMAATFTLAACIGEFIWPFLMGR